MRAIVLCLALTACVTHSPELVDSQQDDLLAMPIEAGQVQSSREDCGLNFLGVPVTTGSLARASMGFAPGGSLTRRERADYYQSSRYFIFFQRECWIVAMRYHAVSENESPK